MVDKSSAFGMDIFIRLSVLTPSETESGRRYLHASELSTVPGFLYKACGKCHMNN